MVFEILQLFTTCRIGNNCFLRDHFVVILSKCWTYWDWTQQLSESYRTSCKLLDGVRPPNPYCSSSDCVLHERKEVTLEQVSVPTSGDGVNARTPMPAANLPINFPAPGNISSHLTRFNRWRKGGEQRLVTEAVAPRHLSSGSLQQPALPVGLPDWFFFMSFRGRLLLLPSPLGMSNFCWQLKGQMALKRCLSIWPHANKDDCG